MAGPYKETVFTQTLQSALKDAGLSQQALASAVGVGQQTVSKWVTGLAMPRPEKIEVLERVLGVPKGKLGRAAGYAVILGEGGELSPQDIQSRILDMEVPALLDTLEIVSKELRYRLVEDSSRMLRAAYDAEVNDGDEGVEAVTQKIKKRRGLK